MPVYDEQERKRQRAVVFWLTILWLAALGFFVTSIYEVDSGGARKAAHWREIGVACLLATGIYLGTLVMTLWRWPAYRQLLLIFSLAGTLCLGFLVIAFGLLFIWIWNTSQYLCLLLGAFAVFRVLRACKAPVYDARKPSGTLPR